ncbi:MAG TPA: class I SAM-dependent methyltransferase [Verrucomicrobiae bacterium]|nr:class I SAM-dependent methyltransferase [Verrucomicrobiae bacterium]
MLQILAFNRHLYAAAALALALGGVGFHLLANHSFGKVILIGWLILTAFWTVSSLVVSHWVYDRSRIYKWTWLADCLPIGPRRWANIHAGLDESSPALRRFFPGAEGMVLDIFDSTEMTELSIAQARLRSKNAITATAANFRALPVDKESLDTVFLIFAAHEIRRAESRLQFFSELERVLKSHGRVVLVEHLRDWNNFLAFGPGCLHFQFRETWRQAARKAGFKTDKEFNITPFVRVFLWEKICT